MNFSNAEIFVKPEIRKHDKFQLLDDLGTRKDLYNHNFYAFSLLLTASHKFPSSNWASSL